MLVLIARYGKSIPLCRTQLVNRARPCLADVAWTVERLPECPVLRSCRRSKASPPRISPRMIRSGLWRREGGFEEIPDGDGRQTILRLSRFETDQVVLVHVNFRGVFDEEDTFIGWDKLSEDIEHRGFSGPSTPSDENVFPRENVVFELVREPPLQCSRLNEVFDAEVPGIEFPDGQSHAVHAAGWNDGRDAAAVGEA